MKTKVVLTRLMSLFFMSAAMVACSSFAQNPKFEKGKKSKQIETIKIVIEKDENGNIIKSDTIVSSSESGENEKMKSFSFKFSDKNDENYDADNTLEKCCESFLEMGNFCKNFSMNASDSVFCMNINNKIKIECNGKEGEEHVQIFAEDDDGNSKSWFEKVHENATSTSKRECKKQVMICINDNGDDEKSGNGKLKGKKVCKIMTSKIVINDASVDEQKLINGNKTESLKELNLENFNISANIGKGKFTVTFDIEKKGDVEIKVTDMSGKVIFNEIRKGFAGNYEKEIDISNNSKGVYLLNIKKNNEGFCKKILIQ